ncbi:MAG TPA: DUF4336 domain-containing protein, partial [Pseudomonadales bacterium]
MTLEALAPDLWVARRPLRPPVGDIGARMTVIRLRDGTLLLHSPVALDTKLHRALDELGAVRWIVGPNKAHHLFLGAYADAFPPRTTVRRAGTRRKTDRPDVSARP